MKLMQIEWLDSCGTTGGWEYKDEIKTIHPTRGTSVGFVLEETDEFITLLQTDSETQVLGRLTIPRVSIMECWNIKIEERPEE